MKVTAGTSKPKEEKAKEFTEKTSGQPKTKANELKIPKSVTDDPQKHHLTHSVRPISNGYVRTVSYNHPEQGHVSHEVFHAENPLDLENGGQEKNPFGKVGGLK